VSRTTGRPAEVLREGSGIKVQIRTSASTHTVLTKVDGQRVMVHSEHILRMPGIPVATDLPRLIYHRRALSNELLLRAVTGTSFFTIRDLGTIAGTDNSNGAAINSRSQVVGASFTSDFSVVDAFLWENGSLADLNSLVSPPSDLHLNVASDINDRGEIAGFGFLLDGEERAFLLIPCDENHPNIAGCDYDLVEESSTATLTNSKLFTQTSASTNPKLPAGPGPMMSSLHRQIMPWYRGLGSQPPK